MKITDIVKVTISSEVPISSRSFLNREAVACIILQNSVTDLDTDTEWKSYEDAVTSGFSPADPQLDDFNNKVKKEIDAWASTFTAHGGSVTQAVFKRIKIATPATDDIVTAVAEAVRGNDSHEALATNIIQVQLMWEHGGALDSRLDEDMIRGIALNLNGGAEVVERKILFVTMPSTPVNITSSTNLAWHQTNIPISGNQVYESALTMAYLSSFIFDSRQVINDVEYTAWNGAPVSTVDDLAPGVGGYSALTSIKLSGNQEYTVMVGGLVGSGERILTAYFVVVITQLCTDALAQLVLGKIKYSQAMFGIIYSTIADIMDKFTSNQLLESNFPSPITRVVNRDGANFWTIKEGEKLPYGYKLVTLPITQADRAARTYSGAILYIALGQQLKTIELRGLMIGGI